VRGLASIELSFHPCNILRDSRRGVSRRNKNVGCGTWKRRFFHVRGSCQTNKHMFEFFSPSGSHAILVYRSYTDTKHRAASLRQQSFFLLWCWLIVIQNYYQGLIFVKNFQARTPPFPFPSLPAPLSSVLSPALSSPLLPSLPLPSPRPPPLRSRPLKSS